MLRKEQNELLTQTSPGTPMGRMFRTYWIPALLADELPEHDCPPVRVKLLSERLLAFRDTEQFAPAITCAQPGLDDVPDETMGLFAQPRRPAGATRTRPPTGCCWMAAAICQNEPDLRDVAPGHRAACHLA